MIFGSLQIYKSTQRYLKNLLKKSLLKSRFNFSSFLTIFLTIILTFGCIPVVSAQFSLDDLSSDSNHFPPPNVSRYGGIETTPIKSTIDGKNLFVIASRTVLDRASLREGEVPVEIRAQLISANLNRAIHEFTDTKSLQVVIAKLNNLTILEVVDKNNSLPLRILTVTGIDAEYHLKNKQELAAEWKNILTEELLQARKLFSPTLVLQRLGQAFSIFLGMLIASGLVWILQRWVNSQRKSLKAQQESVASVDTGVGENSPENEILSSTEAAIAGQSTENETIARMRSHFLSKIREQFTLKRKLSLNTSLKWLFIWLQIIIWYFGIVWIIWVVPVLMQLRFWVIGTPIQILLVLLIISFAIRIVDAIIIRVTNVWRNHEFLSIGEVKRKTLRITTISNALIGLANTVLIIFGLLRILNIIGVPTGSILALGAFVGFAITFGSQSLVKDLVNGCLILLEDQFAVGDVITLGDVSGLVENMNLCVTQLRDGEGSLITIPNSLINQVKNLTRTWSRVDFGIEIAYDADLKKALAVLNKIVLQMYNESEWQEKIIAPPEVLGVDNIAHSGMLIKVWIKTAPLEQWSVGREFRFRVRMAFEEYGIEIGKPQRITYNTSLNNHKQL
jgi:small-conductance mechanosensitive channel